jgi:ketosteroid isomerase-like protein
MESNPDRAAIYGHRDAYNQALRDGDLEGWLATLTDDCVVMAAGIPAVVGKDAVRQWAADSLFTFAVELEYDFEELEFVGARCLAWGWFRQTLTPKDGTDPVELRGKFLDVFHQQPDGGWLLARVAFSTDHE